MTSSASPLNAKQHREFALPVGCDGSARHVQHRKMFQKLILDQLNATELRRGLLSRRHGFTSPGRKRFSTNPDTSVVLSGCLSLAGLQTKPAEVRNEPSARNRRWTTRKVCHPGTTEGHSRIARNDRTAMAK